MSTTGSHYTVLARRFRPQAFDEVVGQEHVARALRNAIRAGRVAHAYMFTGARGVGKTSTARILAKALNCPRVVDGVPCNECEICQGISAGNDVDVLEIDGASNRGIDDIRSLRASVGVRSMRTQFKVYIIDEVHMLTREAFNALLKTLEEPPPNVKFVFCTTEPNKVPDTILSRCQRFDFSSIAETSIAERLRQIAKIEGFEVTEDALELVSRRARGSMRDSQSLFDQLLAFSDGTVSADDVHRMLGTAGDDRLLELFTAIVEHRPGEVLSLLDACFTAGVQPGEFMDQVIGYVRDMMVVLSGGTTVALCAVASRHRNELLAQGHKLGMQTVMAAFQILSDAKTQMFRSTFARTVLEMALVQLSLLENLSALSELLSGRLPAPPENPATAETATEKKNSEPPPPNGTEPPHLTNGGSAAPAQMAPVAPAACTALSAGPNRPELSPAATLAIAGTASAPVNDSPIFIAPAPASAPTAPPPGLTPERVTSLLPELTRACGLTIAAGLKMVQDLQLVGGARLELLLDDTADFARRVLDLPDNRTRIEQEILKLTGAPATVALRLVRVERIVTEVATANPSPTSTTDTAPIAGRKTKTPVPATAASAAAVGTVNRSTTAAPSAARRTPAASAEAPAANLLGDVDPTQDPFVQQIVEAFGATVVKVTKAPASRASASVEQDTTAV
ncbi:MAG: DNA polymerase III subunit gamma/tau [Planctomycetota bacterium]